MKIFILLLIIATYILIAFEDFKWRNIRLAWFGVLLALKITFLLAYSQLEFKSIAINLIATFIMLLVTSIYFILRYNNFGLKKLREGLGTGDVLIFFAAALFFEYDGLLPLFLVAFICGIIGHLLFTDFKKRGAPLAGIISVLTIAMIIHRELFYNF